MADESNWYDMVATGDGAGTYLAPTVIIGNNILSDPTVGTTAASDPFSVINAVAAGVNDVAKTAIGLKTTALNYQNASSNLQLQAAIASINANSQLTLAQKNAQIAALNAQTAANKATGLAQLSALLGGNAYNFAMLALAAAGVWLGYKALK